MSRDEACLGGKAIKAQRSIGGRTKGDESVLGDGNFVETVLGAGNERLYRRANLQAMGYDFDRLKERVAQLFEMPIGEVLRRGRYVRTVPARSVLCYWANRELGIGTVKLARRLHMAQSTATQSILPSKPRFFEALFDMLADVVSICYISI